MENLAPGTFRIRYENPSSSVNGTEYVVKTITGEDHHYFIADGGSHVGGGRLAKKYCQIMENTGRICGDCGAENSLIVIEGCARCIHCGWTVDL